MKIVAACLLAALGGNSSPSISDVKCSFLSVGIQADEDRVKLFFDQVSAKDITELVVAGREKLASVPFSGGAVAAAAAPAAGAHVAAPAEQPKEEKVEEKEESDDDLGMGLFD